MKSINSVFCIITLGIVFLAVSCGKEEVDNTYHFSSDRVGVCSWSWKSDMSTILDAMNETGITGMQLATTPWLAGNLSDAQKEIFGHEESAEVLARIQRLSASGDINIMSTMICFPHEDYSSLETIRKTSGFMFTEDDLGHNAQEEWETNISLVGKAARLTSKLGVLYLSTEVGFVNKDWDLALERVKAAFSMLQRGRVGLRMWSGGLAI